ncbi:MAG: radical SAM protein [Chloroflexota bacterium]|nr:radical SAM protein [Chloroflexota bacterium]
MTRVSPLESLRRQATGATHKIHSLPMLVLMPHSSCNCRCLMCDIWKANAMKRELSREDLEAQMGALRNLHVQRVVLSGGEALMHHNLWVLCELLRELDEDLRITLLSTGLLLEHFAANVVKWCDEVIVSLDGSPEVHDSIRRVPRAFDRLAEGIRALREHRPDYPVSGRCVLQRMNFRDLPRIVDAAHDIGLDRISFMAADVSSTAFNRPQPWEQPRASEVALDTEETAEFAALVEDTIARYAGDFATRFISENPHKLRELPRYYAALQGNADFPTRVCNAPWVSSVVEADGTVRPCFFHRSLGNIHEQSLEHILNSPDAIAFRRGLNVQTDPICKTCVCTLSLGRRSPA